MTRRQEKSQQGLKTMLTKNTRFPGTDPLPIVGLINPALNTFVVVRSQVTFGHLSLFGILALPCLLYPIRD